MHISQIAKFVELLIIFITCGISQLIGHAPFAIYNNVGIIKFEDSKLDKKKKNLNNIKINYQIKLR